MSYGLRNENGGIAILHGGSFTGRGGADVTGIYNGANCILEVEGVTALGESTGGLNIGLKNNDNATAKANNSQLTGSSDGFDQYGLMQDGGTVHLAVSQLDGDAIRYGGTLVCFQVYDGSYAAYTCP
jgi:hypothetical protein